MGGRGANLKDSSGESFSHSKYADIWSYRHRKQNERFVDSYATDSNAECIAEATTDVYCNGKKAKAESKAVVQVLRNLIK